MPNPIHIRQITTGDLNALVAIRLEMLRAHPVAFSADQQVEEERSIEEWQERIQSGAIFLAFDDQDPVAMAGFHRSHSSKTRHHGFIWGVYVKPAYRGRGLCRAIIERCLDWARDNGLTMAYIAAAATNTTAVHCYANCGFSLYGIQPKAIQVDGIYYDEVLMAQEL